ncbi:PP2C family protein-serine/threonine phosphatase [Streptomyces luomodiensis]|uniref:PP2C family protein-serine/threonine phosphatase n=1 Tax=Streptomyces luomodiensis TaxID=3026192 RepID=A0ABY9V597_9ACTN|nr:PP2C family protein-serine/threonine phosphatase [Streptomyces sp. SCA4-21]WNE97900.1 PP2C family protein-serine/threonine phosphatase [Streptomyces sp. SCA4-21]
MRVRGSRARTGARAEWRTAWSRLSGPRVRRPRNRLRTPLGPSASTGASAHASPSSPSSPSSAPFTPEAGAAPGARSGAAEEADEGPPGRRLARWVPAVLVLGGIAYDLAAPPGYTASPFFAAAPLVAAALLPLRQTVVTAVAAVLTTCLLAELHGVADPTQAATEIVTVATVTVLALVINRIVRLGYHRLASARGVAEAAQRAVLPAPPDRLAGLEIAARYVPAEKYAAIGGDLYAVQDTPHGVRLIIGDVRGKGLQAVEVVAILLGCFREAAEQESTLEALVGRLERALQREGARRADLEVVEGFTTAVVAEIPRGDSTLRLINRGHPAPLLLDEDGALRALEPEARALPLGMGEMDGWPDRVKELGFAEGETLLFFTDGVTEARDRNGEFYDPEERLRGQRFDEPQELVGALVADVERHTGGGTPDDMALLAVRRTSARGNGRANGNGRGDGNGRGNGNGRANGNAGGRDARTSAGGPAHGA